MWRTIIAGLTAIIAVLITGYFTTISKIDEIRELNREINEKKSELQNCKQRLLIASDRQPQWKAQNLSSNTREVVDEKGINSSIQKIEIYGYVYDAENHNPVKGAVVSFHGVQEKTDDNGYFTIIKEEVLKRGKKKSLYISHPRYKTNDIKLNMDDTEIDLRSIDLKPKK